MVTFIVYSHINWFSKDVMSRFQIPTLKHICCIYCVKMMFEIPKYFSKSRYSNVFIVTMSVRNDIWL